MRSGATRKRSARRIALTGGIASGKTVVASILRKLGLVVVEADEIAHQVLTEPEVKQQIARAFGAAVFGTDGEVDRRALGAVVFGDPAKLRLLESITHPLILQRIHQQEEEALAAGKTVVSVIPLLFEKGLERCYDRVWATYAPKEVCLKRLQDRDGLEPDGAATRLAAQMDPAEKAARADAVIETHCAMEDLREKVTELVRTL